MKWGKLLCSDRLGGSVVLAFNRTQTLFEMSEFEIDYWRIINSSSFRCLQDKTQVFPLEKNDFVRTRLTHSIEVSSIARQLVEMVYKKLAPVSGTLNYDDAKALEEKYEFTAENAKKAADAAACAGLLHDIGNPPFGHFGEDVIRAWFTNHLDKLCYDCITDNGIQTVALKSDSLVNDLKNFEGNAQALRLVTRLSSTYGEHGLNLTKAVLNTLIKYPTDSKNINSKDDNICIHKLGYYTADVKYFEDITSAENGTGTYFDQKHHRHPLTFILEAADDIAYATADLEDSYKKGLFTINELKKFLSSEVEKTPAEKRNNYFLEIMEGPNIEPAMNSADELRAFQKWINDVRQWFIYCAAYGFKKNYVSIMEGKFSKEIISGTYHERSVEIFKKAMIPFTFTSSGIIKLELSAEKIIGELLDRFVPAAICWDVKVNNRQANEKSDKKLIGLISENHKRAYEKCRDEYEGENKEEYFLYLRLLMVADYISGMTDTYAKTLYQELSGI